ncbi:energy-coupling factor transporter ATP-binding protein EcfA2 [Agromyces terreus]|uniref:Energy-coupling factor transporter ATP-binding protein EcfA2 n=1 Tax=Agromyces terreus TaxID=424795 RepID=A0A9X2GV99_9MICO|nr:AAA family ATPase [Agromyces terreus]MCP2369645.1 energy-coupling factor transporter ATP-binding protein EcfA2 [Agromyces terreus]
MWISRVRVTGGFLRGLDLQFGRGLNVIIGARGAGKTTLLELVRHALGAEHADQSNAKQRQQFLDAVLGAGEIEIDLHTAEGGRRLVVDARGGGRHAEFANSALVLGQSELEEIASDPLSRLRLLDLRIGSEAQPSEMPDPGALSGELFRLREEMADLQDVIAHRDRFRAERDLLSSQEEMILGGGSVELASKREELRSAEERITRTGRELDGFSSLISGANDALDRQTAQGSRLADLLAQAQSLPLSERSRTGLQRARDLSTATLDAIARLRDSIALDVEETRALNVREREIAAPLRGFLEEAESGLGQLTAQARVIETELEAISSKEQRLRYLEGRYAELLAARNEVFQAIEAAEESKFVARSSVAKAITGAIANNVVVVVDHFADSGELRSFLSIALRGSNTRSSLSDAIAERVLPRHLLELVEAQDAAQLSAVAGVGIDRAAKVLDHLHTRNGVEALARVQSKDSVDFRLRDGAVDKGVESLSTGQKCAVTLPILLSERSRALVLDQPEDHLDNAFLVSNVVRGLIDRSRDGAQTIVATHNANIPVLGSAPHVVVLSSNGLNGSALASAPFDDPEIVDAITSLMEGGREAFARRSDFYQRHGGLYG